LVNIIRQKYGIKRGCYEKKFMAINILIIIIIKLSKIKKEIGHVMI